MLRKESFSARFALTVLFLLLVSSAVLSLGQSPSPAGEVHVQPRLPAPVPQDSVIDAGLKGHNKPFKVNVEMVLVPVTITERPPVPAAAGSPTA